MSNEIFSTLQTEITPQSAETPSSFSSIQFSTLSVDDLSELYDVFQLIFCGPNGYFKQGEECLSSLATDDNIYFRRLKVWINKHSSETVDFGSQDVQNSIMDLNKDMKRFTRAAKCAMKKRAIGDTSEPNKTLDDALVRDTASISTRELISFTLESLAARNEKENGGNANNTDIEYSTMNELFTSDKDDNIKKKKRKRKLAQINKSDLYYDIEKVDEGCESSPPQLKPLLIFDLNKVLVWRRKRSNYFVVRPFAIQVLKCLSIQLSL